MIEEIKKEIEDAMWDDGIAMTMDKLFKILDKYKNQETFLNERIDTLKYTQLKQLNKISELEKYKNAWGELKNIYKSGVGNIGQTWFNEYSKHIFKIVQDLEQKYNIGGEND